MRARFALVLFVLLLGPAAAQPIHLTGTVGGYPVFLDLNRNGDTISGWYLYLRVGKEIRLEGKLDHNGFFQFDEYTASSNSHTGSFTGRAKDGRWRGEWKGTSAKSAARGPLPLELTEVRGTLKPVNANLHCTARRIAANYGLRSSQTLNLTLSKGKVTRFSMRRYQYDDTQEQSCKIPAGAMRQRPAPVGVLLRAKADRANASRHCTIRLYQAGDYLVLRTGDASQAGDDCRGAGTQRFCTPNGLWADMVIDRKTSTCKAVE